MDFSILADALESGQSAAEAEAEIARLQAVVERITKEMEAISAQHQTQMQTISAQHETQLSLVKKDRAEYVEFNVRFHSSTSHFFQVRRSVEYV